jgi:hypothetical protein
MSENLKKKASRRQFIRIASAGASAATLTTVLGNAAAAEPRTPTTAATQARQQQGAAAPPASKAGRMIRQLWFGYLNGVDKAEGERWYYRFHAPEFVRWYGPWLRRYETYGAYDPPTEAITRFGAKPGKYTEMWWASMEDYEEADSNKPGKPYTPGTWPQSTAVILTAMTIIPAKPTEAFIDAEPNHEQPIVRWMRVFRYPSGVSREEGDRWYLEIHSQELKQIPGLLRYVSYRALDYSRARSEGPYVQWHRVDELWFSSLATWRQALVESPPRYTAPRWAKEEPFVTMASDFVRIKSDVDFLRDTPRVP